MRKIQVPRPHSQKVHSVDPGEVWQSGYLKAPPLITMLTKLCLVTAGLVQAHPFTGKEMETRRMGGGGELPGGRAGSGEVLSDTYRSTP